jgi:hypothetical protein
MMGPGEHNGYLLNEASLGSAEWTSGTHGHLPSIAPAEGNDSVAGSWESAWIDLGGEG